MPSSSFSFSSFLKNEIILCKFVIDVKKNNFIFKDHFYLLFKLLLISIFSFILYIYIYMIKIVMNELLKRLNYIQTILVSLFYLCL